MIISVLRKKKFKAPGAKLTFRGKNDGIVIFLTFGINEENEKPNGVGKSKPPFFIYYFPFLHRGHETY